MASTDSLHPNESFRDRVQKTGFNEAAYGEQHAEAFWDHLVPGWSAFADIVQVDFKNAAVAVPPASGKSLTLICGSVASPINAAGHASAIRIDHAKREMTFKDPYGAPTPARVRHVLQEQFPNYNYAEDRLDAAAR